MRIVALLILAASALVLCGASDSAHSQKDRTAKHERQSAVEADAASQREHEANVLLSAIQTEQANILKLTEAIKNEADARQKNNNTKDESWPGLRRLTPFKVQQGLFIVGALYAFFAAWQLIQIRRQANIAMLALRTDRPYLILEYAQVTGVLTGDGPVTKETPQPDELITSPRFFPRVILNFRNYGKGPVIFGEGVICIDALATLPAARDFSRCERMGLQANAIRAGGPWNPLAQFNYEADWTALFPDIAAERKSLIAIPPRIEPQTMPPRIAELLAPYRAPGAPDPQTPTPVKMPGDFRRGPSTHNYCD
jgi:hypothetical protein